MNICTNLPNITEIDNIWQFLVWMFTVPYCNWWVFVPFFIYVFVFIALFLIIRFLNKTELKKILTFFPKLKNKIFKKETKS